MRILLTLAFALALPTLAQAAPANGPTVAFTGADLFSLEQASDPQVSPDGKWIAYVRRTADVMTDRMRSSIWLVDVASGRQEPLIATPGSHSNPRWSPDGRRIAYVSAVEGQRPQLFVRWMANGATARVTGLPDSPRGIEWAPDGSRLAYTMTVPDDGVKIGRASCRERVSSVV